MKFLTERSEEIRPRVGQQGSSTTLKMNGSTPSLFGSALMHPFMRHRLDREMVGLFKKYHDFHGAWGSLHVVLDDGNFRLRIVRSCFEQAMAANDMMGALLAQFMLKMTKTQWREINKKVAAYK